jgi:trk system potassium uptake protein
MGTRVAHSFTVPNVVDYLAVGPEYGISKLKPPPPFVGKTIAALQLREQYGFTLLMIERSSQVVLHPRWDDTVRPDDLLVVAGLDEAMERLWQ